jgi:ribosomal protein L10
MAIPKAHVSDAKKARVKKLAERLKHKTVMIVSIKGLPSAQFQDIKKKLRDKAHLIVPKKSLLNHAIEAAGNKELKKLEEFNGDATALLFSDHDAFEISGILADNKSPAKAKAGDIALADVEVKAGPTGLLPGPDISALSAVGLAPKVEDGKISVMQDKIIVKEGEEIKEEHASIMAKLDIVPFEVGIEPVAAFMDGQVYKDIKIDKPAFLEDFLAKFGRVAPFAVEIGYVCPETLDFIIGKAGMEGNAIEALIGESNLNEGKSSEEGEDKTEESAGEEKEEEAPKAEEEGEVKPTEEEKPVEEKPAEEEKKEETKDAGAKE